MIVPPAAGEVPPEAPGLYGDRVDFVAAGLGLWKLTPEGYNGVIQRVGKLSRELASEGAQAVSLMGTSLSFYRGPEYNTRLIEIMRAESGLPATTMSTSVLDALAMVGAKRLVVATPYVASVNRLLADFLVASELEVTRLHGSEIERVEDILAVSQEELLRLGRDAMQGVESADALLISCGGLRTEEVTRKLEVEFGIPVISSALAGAWGAVRLVGLSGQARAGGCLFSWDSSNKYNKNIGRFT
ncbi:arylmalonate decarboxylase [Billgrantia zhangzhouensis]|nr:aspartate/glutamate racemase family protein [Halomonas zhangzhouensis]